MSESRTYYKYKDGSTGRGSAASGVSPSSASADLEDAYKNRLTLTTPVNLQELTKLGFYRFDGDSWEGADYPPSECIPHGNFDLRNNGTDIILTFTDDNGFTAELRKINGEWPADDENNPGGWEYYETDDIKETDEEGNQLGLAARIERGKVMKFYQFAIRPGEKFKGLLPGKTVKSGVPVLASGEKFNSINGTTVYYIPDWTEITDGPSNLTGSGFLKIGFYDGLVQFQAYDFNDGKTGFAQATIPGVNQQMTAWMIDKDIFCTIEQLQNSLSLYALKEHNHDDLYNRKFEISQILSRYRLSEVPIEMAEIPGLNNSLANKIDTSIFQNATAGSAIVLGADGIPVAADLSDAYTTTVTLVNAKEGDAYSTVIQDISLIYPLGASNKRISPQASEKWVTFSGSIVGGTGSNLTIAGTPTNDRNVIISLDFVWTVAGQERREQRILFLSVEAAAATITAPNAPTGLNATAVSTSQINLSWTDNATNEAVQEIERSTASDYSGAVKIATLEANVTGYQDKVGLSPNTRYYYRVRAANSGGNSAWATDNEITNAEAAVTTGLHANYYDTDNIRSLGSVATARTDNTINFDVTNDAPAGAAVTTGAYIVRWSGKIKFPVSGRFVLTFATNAGTRIYLNGELAVSEIANTAQTTFAIYHTATAGIEVPILIEYVQTNDDTYAKLGYQDGATNNIVPTSWLIPVNIVPLATPVLTATNVASDTVRLSWTLTTNPDAFEVFGGAGQITGVLPLLSNINPAGTARTIDVNGLPAGQSYTFEIRSKKDGIFSERSDRAVASTPNAADRPTSAAPVLLFRSTVNTSELTVRFQDNNTGDTETYGFRFQQVNTTAWKYLNSSSGLSDNAADMHMRSYPFDGSLRVLTLSNDFFAGKLIRVEVIVKKGDLFSDWAGAQESSAPIDNQLPDVVYMEAFRLVKDTATGLWYDAEAETDNSSFHNFYFCEDRTELLLNDDGTPKPFTGKALPSYSYLMFRKLRLHKATFPTFQRWMSDAWLTNMSGGNPSLLQYCAQNIVRTFDERNTTTPGPTDPPPTTGRKIDYDTAYTYYINLYTMEQTAWRTEEIKQIADTCKAAGFKAMQVSFAPYKVWNNYSSPGAFDPDNLTWNWEEINKIIYHICEVAKLKLIVRLQADMNDITLWQFAANVENTPALQTAWASYLDRDGAGDATGLKIDNLTTPPWMLFRRFCAAFKAQYANYWDSGKILVWEFATNRNQEAQIHPETTSISMPPNFTQYTERTEQMYAMGQMMLGVMSGWEDNQWNVGSWVNEGFQIRGNSMGYNRFLDGFKGMRGNHDSNWSKDERDFHDLVMYTRTKKGSGRYFSVEYFRKDNVTEASAMAQAMKNSIDNGSRFVGFVFGDGNINNVLVFINDVAARLGSAYHTRPIATPQVTPVDNNFTLLSVFNTPYTTSVSVVGDLGVGGGMLGQYLFNKVTMQNIPQYMSITV